MHKYIYTYIHLYIHACRHTHIHTYIYTYTCMRRQTNSQPDRQAVRGEEVRKDFKRSEIDKTSHFPISQIWCRLVYEIPGVIYEYSCLYCHAEPKHFSLSVEYHKTENSLGSQSREFTEYISKTRDLPKSYLHGRCSGVSTSITRPAALIYLLNRRGCHIAFTKLPQGDRLHIFDSNVI